MACFTPDERDYSQEYRDNLATQLQYAPQKFAAEQQYGPEYAKLEAQKLRNYLTGPTGAAQTYADILPTLSAAESQATQMQRQSDLEALRALGPNYTLAMLSANPQQKALMDALNARSMQDLQLGTAMDPATARYLQQQTLGTASANGWGYNPGNLAAAQMNASGYGDQLLSQRFARAAQTAGINQAVTGDPMLQVLGRQGQSFSAMNSMGNTGAAASGRTSDIFNPESAYASNIYAANQANDLPTWDRVQKVSDTVGSFIGSVGGGVMCWVAREVFGESDPRWRLFRNWLLFDAPVWFHNLYLTHGERFAGWLKRHPWAKGPVRRWMQWIIERRDSRLRKEINLCRAGSI